MHDKDIDNEKRVR